MRFAPVDGRGWRCQCGHVVDVIRAEGTTTALVSRHLHPRHTGWCAGSLAQLPERDREQGPSKPGARRTA
jgi:hypothetical protein